MFTAILIGIKYDTQFNRLSKLTYALIFFQTAFIIALLYELYYMVKQQKVKRISRIQLSHDFWETTEHRFLYMYVMNGERFVEMINNNSIKVSNIKLIAPSQEAIELYYKNDKVVNNKERAIGMITSAIETVESAMKTLIEDRQIKGFEVRRSPLFPLDFFAIFDAQVCLNGKYFKDPLRKESIGLKSTCWIERDPVIVNTQTQYFEELWEAISED